MALTLGLVTISYGPRVYLQVLVFPELFGTLGTALILVLVGIYQIRKRVQKREYDKKNTDIKNPEENVKEIIVLKESSKDYDHERNKMETT